MVESSTFAGFFHKTEKINPKKVRIENQNGAKPENDRLNIQTPKPREVHHVGLNGPAPQQTKLSGHS